MGNVVSRPRRRAVVVRAGKVLACLVGLGLATPASAGDGVAKRATATMRPARDSEMVEISTTSPPIFGVAPEGTPRATFVYLHGVCGLTTNGCGHFGGAPGWLVCPQANATCRNGGSSWGGSTEEKAALVDRAVDAAHEAWPESKGAPVVLVGFSQGAYVAMDVARARPGRYAGMVLLGADTGHAVERLRAAKVPRVALVCGAYDMMFPSMRDTPRALTSLGVAARFESLGHVGHTYVGETGDDVLTRMLAWVTAEEGA